MLSIYILFCIKSPNKFENLYPRSEMYVNLAAQFTATFWESPLWGLYFLTVDLALAWCLSVLPFLLLFDSGLAVPTPESVR